MYSDSSGAGQVRAYYESHLAARLKISSPNWPVHRTITIHVCYTTRIGTVCPEIVITRHRRAPPQRKIQIEQGHVLA